MATTDVTISALQGARPAGAFAALNPLDDNLSDGIGSGYGVIGYKGKVWTLRHRGEKHVFVRTDDGSPSAFLDVILLRSVAYKSKSYYPAGSFTDAGSDGQRPVCSSLDGVTPDPDAQVKQSAACAICPRNEWKVNPDGHKGRECTDYKRISVLILPSLTARLLGAALMEPVFLRVPAGSLTELGVYGDNLAAQGWHYSAVVTRIGFDPQAPHPKMSFRAIQALTDKEAPMVLPLREAPLAKRITGENEVGKPRPTQQALGIPPEQPSLAAPVVVQPTATASPSTTMTVTPAQTVTSRSEPAADMSGFNGGHGQVIDVKPNPPVTVAVTPPVTQPEPDTVDTGFGEVGTNVVQLNVAADKNTTEDTGPASEADMDLDARIAARLGGLLPA